MLIKKYFRFFLCFFFTISCFCEGASVGVGPFSALKLHKDFKKEHYLRQSAYVPKFPLIKPLEISRQLIVYSEKNYKKPYSVLCSLEPRLQTDPFLPCVYVFSSFSSDIFEKYFFDVVVDAFMEKNKEQLSLSSKANVMFGYDENSLISLSFKRIRRSYSYIIDTNFPIPFFSKVFFSAWLKYFYREATPGKNDSFLVPFSNFVLDVEKIPVPIRMFVNSQAESIRILLKVESAQHAEVNNSIYSNVIRGFFNSESFFLSLKPEYVVELSREIKLIGKLNFIFSRGCDGNVEGKDFTPSACYPGLDVEYRKNDNFILFIKTNNGCSFYDLSYICEKMNTMRDSLTSPLQASFDRLNLEIGFNNVYSSNFKWSFSLPFHWKQLISQCFRGGGADYGVSKDFKFFVSPFFSFDISLCRRKLIISFSDKINIKRKDRLSPLNHTSLKISWRCNKKHIMFLSVQIRNFARDVSGYNHRFYLFFEYNWYLNENLLFFIKLLNIERLLFDKVFCRKRDPYLDTASFDQVRDEFGNGREPFYIAVGLKIPM